MNFVSIALQRNPIAKDILYWTLFVMLWAFLWGLSDQQYLRNFFIQVCSLPARMLLVYFTIWYLFPRYFNAEKYLSFIGLYGLLLLVITLAIQRPVILYFVQPHFLPIWNDRHFISTYEIISTALDVNIAAIVPVGYKMITTYKERAGQLHLITQNIPPNEPSLQFIEVKAEKAIHKILIDEIIYIESQRNKVRIRLAAKEIIARETISSVEESLCAGKFKRVHRSFLVNTNKITAISSTKVVCNDLMVPIGRKYKGAVRTCVGLEN